MGFYERIMQFKNKEESTSAFARRLGVSEASLRYWRAVGIDGMGLRFSTINRIAGVVGCEPAWLVYGIKACSCKEKAASSGSQETKD